MSLKIHAATFGGADFTNEIQDLVQSDQTLNLDTNFPGWQQSYHWQDPWPGTVKSLTILYQWGERPLELVVTSENQGTVVLDPSAPVSVSRTMFINPAGGRTIFQRLPDLCNRLGTYAGPVEHSARLNVYFSAINRVLHTIQRLFPV